MDELSERGRELLRKILSRGRIAYDSLSEDERKVIDELVRLGYVRLYVEPNSRRLGDALKIIGSTGGFYVSLNYMNYLCLALALLIPSLFLYLSIRSFVMGYAAVGIFFLIITLGLTYISILIIRRRNCRLIKP
ncbi:hypothetical protein [Vulcanisaeta distributa]|uniref:Uncharacterized protein n=1 Tax=Vulcanisaeta distributa (strain DSM 14429 / JCM 11212 / NBRC 100878 / IC-017) TaxID=572478 RepID=E1QNE1_VULDI|nr:hypothetical protein [Vulcanisaeta distributa]ADN50111.1 hypothetical protein Vdis_0718 [Vulcanisaeta distributa DSM 14429]